jgi:hypothetical protein
MQLELISPEHLDARLLQERKKEKSKKGIKIK